MDHNNLSDWVNERLAKLDPGREWQPDAERAFARFNERRFAKSGLGRMWLWGAATAAAACACLLAFPTSRDIVQRLLVGHSDSKMVYVGQVYADLKTLKYGQAPPDFDLQDTTGNDVRLSDYRGKVVLINFWATWCDVCKTEVPWLIEFENKYRTEGLEVIGISLDDDGAKAVQPFVTQHQVNYPVLVGDISLLRTYTGALSLPATVVIDREGKVSAASVGVVNKDECEDEIVKLLKE
jgi:peroxiredoxin